MLSSKVCFFPRELLPYRTPLFRIYKPSNKNETEKISATLKIKLHNSWWILIANVLLSFHNAIAIYYTYLYATTWAMRSKRDTAHRHREQCNHISHSASFFGNEHMTFGVSVQKLRCTRNILVPIKQKYINEWRYQMNSLLAARPGIMTWN